MHLCEISPERIHEVEIPTGLPMVYDQHRKCIRLLDDGLGDHFSRYDFGTAPELLFKVKVGVQKQESVTAGGMESADQHQPLSVGAAYNCNALDPIIRLSE